MVIEPMTNKKGRFFVNGGFFQGLNHGEGVNLFHGMIILDVRHDFCNDRAEYIAIHEDFKPVVEGRIIPEYIGVFNSKSIYPKWELVNDK